MNIELIISIIQLAAGIIRSQLNPSAADKIDVATALGRIVLKGREAYEQHVGAPLDESLIKPEPPL